MTFFELLLLRSAHWLAPGIGLAWALALLAALAGWMAMDAQWWIYALLSILGIWVLRRWVDAVREQFIRVSHLPITLKRALRAQYPSITPRQADLAERALRQFFIACLRSRGQYTAMPSLAADAMWDAFAHRSPTYAPWCRTALGYVPEYSPVQTLGKKAHFNDGLRRTWYWACCDESIDPRNPSRLPLLFALDAKLELPGGQHYAPNPTNRPGATRTDKAAADTAPGHHYGSSFSDGGYSGHAEDFGGVEPRRLTLPGGTADGDRLDNDTGEASDGAGDGGDGGGDRMPPSVTKLRF